MQGLIVQSPFQVKKIKNKRNQYNTTSFGSILLVIKNNNNKEFNVMQCPIVQFFLWLKKPETKKSM
jgi:hypothetical protein